MFAPVIPSAGIGGWQYLKRTYDNQVDLFSKSPQLERDIKYFTDKISSVRSASDLVQDRRLLTVALGAFGLQDDIGNKFFIEKILQEGTTARDSLANRFSDNRYKEFSKAFGLGPGEISPVARSDFASEIVDKFRASSFEVAVGQQDDSMRIALYANRVLSQTIASPGRTEEQKTELEISGLVDEFADTISEDSEYFSNNIETILEVDDLIDDKRLLKFALEAFGLGDDFEEIVSFVPSTPEDANLAEERIRSVLSEGSISNVAAANQLDNPKYLELSKAFGFGFAESLRTNDFGFSDLMTDRYIQQNFTLPADLEYSKNILIVDSKFVFEPYQERDASNDTKWLTLMGEPPLRSLFEKALNLPSEFGQADIDQQLEVFKQRARQDFGTDNLADLSAPQIIDEIIVKYLARSQLEQSVSLNNPASIALSLLRS